MRISAKIIALASAICMLGMSGCEYFQFYEDKLGESESKFYDLSNADFVTDPSNFKYETAKGGIKIKSYTGDATEVSVPETIDGQTVTAIGTHAFAQTDVTLVYMPDTITEIGDWAFANCVSLNTISSLSNLKSLGEYAFTECWSLSYVKLLGSFKEIKRSTFYNCKALLDAEFSQAVGTIGESAFEKCEILREFPKAYGVKNIGAKAFSGCKKIKDFNGNIQFVKIGESAFRGCTALYQPILPDTLTSVAGNAFADCTGIAFVGFKGETVIASTAFKGCDKEMGVFGIPGSSVESFANSGNFPFGAISSIA